MPSIRFQGGLTRGAALLALAAAACAPPPVRISPERRAEVDATARQAIAAEAARASVALPERTIAVTPFAVAVRDSTLANLGYGLADLLSTDLARSRQLVVVDRLGLDATLRELQLVESGRVDPETAPRVGRLVGARHLVVGALRQPDGATLGIQARVADVATSQVQGALDATASLDAVLDAQKAIAFRLFDELGVTLSPAERARIEQRPTQNLAALVAYGNGVRYELEGRLDDAASAYLGALRQDPAFQQAAARLDGVRPGYLALGRALDGAANRLNASAFLPTLGTAVDPAFFPAGTALIIVIGGEAVVSRRLP